MPRAAIWRDSGGAIGRLILLRVSRRRAFLFASYTTSSSFVLPLVQERGRGCACVQVRQLFSALELLTQRRPRLCPLAGRFHVVHKKVGCVAQGDTSLSSYDLILTYKRTYKSETVSSNSLLVSISLPAKRAAVCIMKQIPANVVQSL